MIFRQINRLNDYILSFFQICILTYLLNISYVSGIVLGAGDIARNNPEEMWSNFLGNTFLFFFSCYFSMYIYCQSLPCHYILITFIALLHTLSHNKHYYNNTQIIDKGARTGESRSSASQQQVSIFIIYIHLNFFYSKPPLY